MREQGPFDRLLQTSPRRERAPIYILIAIAALAVLLLILVLPPISILSGGESVVVRPGGIQTRALGGTPEAPEGFSVLSRLYEISAPESGSAVLTVNLDKALQDTRNLSLFTYHDGNWERLGAAKVVNDGTAAQGEVTAIPENVAVLQRTTIAHQIMGWLPANSDIYEGALGALTAVNPLDYAPAADGTVLGEPSPLPADTGLLVYPTIRALVPPESEAVDTILDSSELRQNHVAEIVRLVDEGAYEGIDIDYRAVNPARRDGFTEFVQVLAGELHHDGHSLILTLPLPMKEGVEWQTGAYDWKALGEAADAIKLAPERDQSVYFERMEEVLGFLSGQVDSSKLLLMVSPFSNEKDATGVRPLTFVQALTLATNLVVRSPEPVETDDSVTIVGQNIFEEEGASGVLWDDGASAVSFIFAGEGGAHTVWIENAFSIAFKLTLVQQFGLGGVAVEDVSAKSGGGNIWPPLEQFAASGSVDLVKPNDNMLRPRWSADAGSLEDGTHGAVTWKAPSEAGTYDVTLVVGDGVLRMGQRLSVVVEPRGTAPPVEGEATPVEGEATPVEGEATPVEGVATPVEGESLPGEETPP
jgi:hypothetical protein